MTLNLLVDPSKPPTKAQIVEQLLKTRRGATIAKIADTTGWQPHSCRAFLTGLRKKGRSIVRSTGKDGTNRYQLRSARLAVRGSAPVDVASEERD